MSLMTVLVLIVILVDEVAVRKREENREPMQSRQTQQQPASNSTERKDLNNELARKNEIAEKPAQFTKKITERLTPDA